VGTGLQVMAAMMSADLEAACGPRGKHDPARTAARTTAVRAGRV
jgi:putative transposase